MISLKDKNVLLVNAFDDEIEQEGNGKYQLSFKYPTSDQRWKNIDLADLLLADDLHGEQEFRVFEIVKRNGYIFVYANQVVDDLNSYSISNISVDRVNGQTAMQALAGSIIRKHPFAFYSDIQDRHVFNQKNISVMDALANGKHSIIGQWGGDLVRDKYNVNLLKRGGRESEALFMYKKNLKSYAETNSIKGLFTRLNLSVKDLDIKTTVDSPLIDSYGGRIYELNIEVADQDVTTLEQLQEYGRNYFAEKLIDVPNNSLTISVTDSQEYDVRIFDTVFVHHEIFDKDLRMKITSYRFSPMGSKLKSIGFGKIKTSLTQQVSNIATEVAEQSVSVAGQVFEKKLQKEIENADKVIDGKINKVRDEINDSIEQSKAEAEAHADNIKQQIDGQLAESERLYQQAQQAQDRQIADVLAKAQANTILATDAKNIGNQAKADAANALSKAIQYKNEAFAEATRFDTVERQATETKLATAKSQAISEATRLVETAKSLLSGQISNLSTDLSQTKEAIKLLATKATVETLTGRVSSAEAMIQVQADQISQRVKTSDFDQAKQRISTAESSITQLGNRITTEISETVAKIPTELGIRNLIKGTKDLSGNNPNQNTSDTYLGFNIARSRPSSGYIDTFRAATTINATATSYVTTFYARSDVDGFLIDCHLFSPNTTTSAESSTGHKTKAVDGLVNVRLTTEWTRYWVKWTQTPVNEIKNFIVGRNRVGRGNATVEIAGVALYEGDIPKDWSPAPEDVVAEIENVKTTITQTAEGQQQLSTRLIETQSKVTSAETKIRQLVNDVSSKVSQTTFDNLKRTVDSQGTSISQNHSAIALKAEKTYVDGVKTTADNAMSKANANANIITQTKAELKIVNDAIETKATKADLNNVTGRLTTAETTIRTQAGQIEQRLTSTQVDSAITAKGYQTASQVNTAITAKGYQTASQVNTAITGKGYQTASQVNTAITEKGYQTKSDVDNNIAGRGYITNAALQPYALSTTVQTLVRETADSFSRTISETRALIPSEVGTRNLALETSSEWNTAYNKFNTDGTPINIYLAKVLTDGLKVGDTIQIYVEVSAGLEGSNIQMRLQGDGDVTGWGTGNFPISQWRTYTSAGGYVFKYSATVNENHIKNSFWTARLRVDGATSGWVRHRKFKVERGKVRTDWSPAVEDLATVTALHEVKDTVSSHTRTISALDGSVSQAIQTANGILSRVGTLESNVADKSSVSAVQNQVNQLAGSWAVQNLTSSGQILNQFNLLANGTNRIDGRLTHITGQTLIDNGVINNAMIGNLDAGKITTGYLASARIATNSITGSHMVFDQAFFNGLMANEAYLKQLFAKNAFITSVQAVAISASNVTTGILRATNGAMDVNLDNASMVFRQDAKIEFQSENNTLFRTRNGTSVFIHFRDDGYNGVYTAMGVNADNTGTQNDYSSGRFAGVRVIRTNPNRYSGTTIDQVQLIGDEIRMRHGYGYENDYLIVNYDGGPKINLMAWLRQFNTNFMHLVNITGTW
ncbi:gp58-like family protein [Streptococcus suis]|uniref:phage tail spike protein n=1 Tax=Streptococcus suis TaxID=1307 RepID=UPI00240DC11E|nr:phage tail spike protein [Streptococcus suis]WFA75650.1 gp58-like family protein [Streptococcus suis]